MPDEAQIERRIKERARHLWQAAGSPPGGPEEYTDEAREIVAIEDAQDVTLQPAAPPRPEEAKVMENLGEFRTLTDQGEERTFPKPNRK